MYAKDAEMYYHFYVKGLDDVTSIEHSLLWKSNKLKFYAIPFLKILFGNRHILNLKYLNIISWCFLELIIVTLFIIIELFNIVGASVYKISIFDLFIVFIKETIYHIRYNGVYYTILP